MGKRRPTFVPPPELPRTLHGVLPDHTLDLHGVRASDAVRRVQSLLEAWTRTRTGAVLRIVTGKGNHSADGPVLLGLVEDTLRGDARVAEMVMDAGGGGWLVRVGSRAETR